MSSILQPSFVGVTLLLFRREIAAKVASPWLFIIASVLCLMAWLYGAGFEWSFETESVLVTTDPLMALNLTVVIFLGLVLGLRLASSIAWEREHHTLDVLLVGPVSPGAVVAAKFFVELSVFAVLMAIYVAYLLIAQPLGRGVIAPADVLPAGQMPLHALPILALGLLVSAQARTVRAAVVVYLAVTGLLALFEIILGVLNTRPFSDLNLTAIYLRAVLQSVAWLLQPVSPVSRLADLVDGLVAQTPPAVSDTLLALALTGVLLTLAVLLARLRGADI